MRNRGDTSTDAARAAAIIATGADHLDAVEQRRVVRRLTNYAADMLRKVAPSARPPSYGPADGAADAFAAMLNRGDASALLAAAAYGDDVTGADILTAVGAPRATVYGRDAGPIGADTADALWRRHGAMVRNVTRSTVRNYVRSATVEVDADSLAALDVEPDAGHVEHVRRRLDGAAGTAGWSTDEHGAPAGPYGRRAAMLDATDHVRRRRPLHGPPAPIMGAAPRPIARDDMAAAHLAALDADGPAERSTVTGETGTGALHAADTWETVATSSTADTAARRLRKVTRPRSSRRASNATRRAALDERSTDRTVRLLRETPLLSTDDTGAVSGGLLAAMERIRGHHALDGPSAGRTVYGDAVDRFARGTFRDAIRAAFTAERIGGRNGSARSAIACAVAAMLDASPRDVRTDRHAMTYGAMMAAAIADAAHAAACAVTVDTADAGAVERHAVARSAADVNARRARRRADDMAATLDVLDVATDYGRRPLDAAAMLDAATSATVRHDAAPVTDSLAALDVDHADALNGPMAAAPVVDRGATAGTVDVRTLLVLFGLPTTDTFAAAMRATLRNVADHAWHAAAHVSTSTTGAAHDVTAHHAGRDQRRRDVERAAAPIARDTLRRIADVEHAARRADADARRARDGATADGADAAAMRAAYGPGSAIAWAMRGRTI